MGEMSLLAETSDELAGSVLESSPDGVGEEELATDQLSYLPGPDPGL